MTVFNLMLAVGVVALAGAFILYVSINYKKIGWVSKEARAALDSKIGYVFYNSMGVGTLVLALVILNSGMETLHSEDAGYSENAVVDTREGIGNGKYRYVLPDLSGVSIGTDYSKIEPALQYILNDVQRLYPLLSKAYADKDEETFWIAAVTYAKAVKKANKDIAAFLDILPGMLDGHILLEKQGRITADQRVVMGFFYALCFGLLDGTSG